MLVYKHTHIHSIPMSYSEITDHPIDLEIDKVTKDVSLSTDTSPTH